MVYSSSTPAEKKMATENPDDIVISGMSIRCSQSDNVEEFAKNLYDGVNMVHENLQRCDEGQIILRHLKIILNRTSH
jgi:Beta-ketoacyl synthase, N-terminal domain